MVNDQRDSSKKEHERRMMRYSRIKSMVSDTPSDAATAAFRRKPYQSVLCNKAVQGCIR